MSKEITPTELGLILTETDDRYIEILSVYIQGWHNGYKAGKGKPPTNSKLNKIGRQFLTQVKSRGRRR